MIASPGLMGGRKVLKFKELFEYQTEAGTVQLGALTSLLRLEPRN